MSVSAPFLSRPYVVAALPQDGTRVVVEATAAERDHLAAFNNLVGLSSLIGRFELKPQRRGKGIRVQGEVVGEPVLTCVVSLEPFGTTLREAVDLVFLPEADVARWESGRSERSEVGLDDEDPPEAIVDGRIDLGQVTAEALALGIDPYPRKPGVEFDEAEFAAEKEPSPFAVLSKLRDKP